MFSLLLVLLYWEGVFILLFGGPGRLIPARDLGIVGIIMVRCRFVDEDFRLGFQ